MSLKGRGAIVGLGITPQGKVYDSNHVGFAVEAVRLALDDAGLQRADLDGLLLNPGLTWGDQGMGSFQLQQAMGLRNLRLSASMNLGGATACAMIQQAVEAIDAGLCRTVACVFSDAPLKPPKPKSERTAGSGGSAGAYGFARGLDAAYGQFGINAMYAMVARRHMHHYGTTNDHLGGNRRRRAAVGESQSGGAVSRHADDRRGVPPLALGGGAVSPVRLLSGVERRAGGHRHRRRSGPAICAQPPVYVWGMGQGHPGGDPAETLTSGAVLAKEPAFRMAGVASRGHRRRRAVRLLHVHGAGLLEDYGFCKKGEGGPFVADGKTAPGGSLPVNTGGGQLSSFYMWGMTPVSEAVIQLRGDGGARQVPDARRRAGERQRRHPLDPLDARPE